MKKFLSLMLVLAMLAAMLCIPTFAVTETLEGAGSQDIDVYLDLNGEVIHKFSVDIEYVDMIFTYKSSSKWSADSYEYVTESGWQTTERNVTIVNHSDLKIQCDLTAASEGKYSALSLNLDNDDFTLNPCTPGIAYGSINKTVKVTVSGDLPADAADNDQIGTLTVTLTAIS